MSGARGEKVYLGDGVYASHDGYQIWLTVNNSGGQERIALEPAVFDALLRFNEGIEEGRRAQALIPDAEAGGAP